MADISKDFDGPMIDACSPNRLTSPWRSVKHELPEIYQVDGQFHPRVLVRTQDLDESFHVEIDTYTGARWGWSAHGHRVTHWQPLPATEIGP